MIVLAWLARDASAEARRQLEAALVGRTPHRSAWQHYMGMYGHVHVDLYTRRPDLAWARLEEARPVLRRAQMFRLESVRLETRLLRARCALALAQGAGGRARTRLLRQAAADGRRVGRERARWSGALAASVAAGVAMLQGDEAAAARHLGEAARGFAALDLGLHAAAARWYLADLTPGAAGVELRRQQEGWMTRQDVAAPARMAGVLVPGFAR
jgi:hypothetical protein